MPGDYLKKVQAGDPVVNHASMINAFIDTTLKFRAQQQQQSKGDSAPLPWPLTHAYVENGTESDLDQFAVLGIDGPLVDPSDNADTFAEKVRLAGVEPTTDHVGNGNFAILLEPCAAGSVALCAIAGATVCLINVSDEAHRFADAEAGTTDALASANNGPAQILWKETGTGDGKRAIVRIGNLPEEAAVTVKITEAVDGSGGKYHGVIYDLQDSTAGDTSDLAMPEGMTAGDACLILHTPENGKPTHWIEANSYSTGVVVGRTTDESPLWIVVIPNGTYRTASPDSLAATGLTADTHSWARDDVAAGDQYGDGPIESTTERVEWDDGTGELVKFVRTVLHDAGGNKVSESAETRVVIVAFGECA